MKMFVSIQYYQEQDFIQPLHFLIKTNQSLQIVSFNTIEMKKFWTGWEVPQ